MAVDRTFLYVWTLDSNSGSAPTVSNVPSSPPPDCSAAGKGVSLLQHAKRKRQERQRLSPSPPLKHREHRHQSSVESQWKRKDGQRPSPPSHLHPHSDPVELLRRFPVGVHRCRRRRRRLQHPKERHRLKKKKGSVLDQESLPFIAVSPPPQPRRPSARWPSRPSPRSRCRT